MNDIAHQRMVQEAVRKKFGSHKVLRSKRPTAYPHQAEREYQRITNAYMKLLNKRLKEYLPKIVALAKAEEQGRRQDDLSSFLSSVVNLFAHLSMDLQTDIDEFDLIGKIESMAALTRKLSISEWKKQVKATLGLDLYDDYYMGEFYREAMKRWVDGNVDLIKTIPQDTLDEMREQVLEGFRSSRPTKAILKDIQETYDVDKRHARLIARDQIAKLNSEITQQQQRDAGVTQYEWSTSRDARVRESHAALDGKRFSWDDPPVVDERTGRRCHPGEDYQCRCVALAVFDFSTLDLPIQGDGGG